MSERKEHPLLPTIREHGPRLLRMGARLLGEALVEWGRSDPPSPTQVTIEQQEQKPFRQEPPAPSGKGRPDWSRKPIWRRKKRVPAEEPIDEQPAVVTYPCGCQGTPGWRCPYCKDP